jgi:uncharacterized membrane protein YpjA
MRHFGGVSLLGLVLDLWKDFWRDPWQWRFTLPLVIINALGSAYGFYWYHEQLAVTPVWLWLFVADSPLASTLFTLALLIRGSGAMRQLFQVIAFTAAIKYGLWAIVIITQFWINYGQVGPTEVMLWASHLGMAIEGVIFLKTMQFRRVAAGITLLWMILNDLLDYCAGLHPYLFAPEQESLAQVAALVLTGLIAAGLLLLQRHNSARLSLK